MLYITTRLKRVRALRLLANVCIFTIGFPFYALYFLGKISEHVIHFLLSCYYLIEEEISDILGFDEAAKKQYKNNPQKFD